MEVAMSDAVVQEASKLAFWEEDLLVKTLDDEKEWRQSYRLRHRVFAEGLQWVPERPEGLETDIYDSWSSSIGLFSRRKQLLGMVRMTQAPLPFMLESEFSACLIGSHEVRKATDTAEITRLAVDPGITDRGLSARLIRLIFKGMYRWCLAHDVRYTYMVVEHRLLRVVRWMGWPCHPIGGPVVLPPAGVASIAALLDLDEFRANAVESRAELLSWLSSSREPASAKQPTQGTCGTPSPSIRMNRTARRDKGVTAGLRR
jgi:acyl homoserine lactone synthase